MDLINEWREVKHTEEPLGFLYSKFGMYDGGIDFVDAVNIALKKNGRDLIWFCGMFSNYHNHDDYTIESLLRTKKHVKNIALGYLNKQDYDMFNMWIKNWANTLIICNHIAPERWEKVVDPVRSELGYDDLP